MSEFAMLKHEKHKLVKIKLQRLKAMTFAEIEVTTLKRNEENRDTRSAVAKWEDYEPLQNKFSEHALVKL